MTALVLGIDSSTQSCKAELRSIQGGDLVASGSAPHPSTRPPTSEQPASSWWEALVSAVRRAVAELPQPWRPGDVVAISVAAQCHGLVLLDHRGEVIRPVKLWNDSTSAPQIERLRTVVGRQTWIETVGSLPTAAFTIGKVAWVAEHEPHQLARTSAILLPHDWLTYQLTGQLVTDRSDASGTGYFDSASDTYRRDLLELATGKCSAVALPTVLGPDDQAGTLLSGPAEQLGLRTEIPVGPGGGDQHLSALGLGVRPGEVVYSIGTSGVVFTRTDHPVHDGSGMVDGVADATGRWLPLCSTLNAAKVMDTVAGWLGVGPGDLGDLAAIADAGPDRPVLAAFFDGERKPDLPHATGVLSGLTNATRREALALAAIEGFVLGLINARDALSKAGVAQHDHVVVTGGGARLAETVRVLADFDQRLVYRPAVDEPVARGACVQAAAIHNGCRVSHLVEGWRPDRELAATPRSDRHIAAVKSRYQLTADWRGADQR